MLKTLFPFPSLHSLIYTKFCTLFHNIILYHAILHISNTYIQLLVIQLCTGKSPVIGTGISGLYINMSGARTGSC